MEREREAEGIILESNVLGEQEERSNRIYSIIKKTDRLAQDGVGYGFFQSERLPLVCHTCCANLAPRYRREVAFSRHRCTFVSHETLTWAIPTVESNKDMAP